eukprot:COSAG02_NODE_32876_length_509_cov_0.704878_1_plen_34_part_01
MYACLQSATGAGGKSDALGEVGEVRDRLLFEHRT